VETIRKIPVQIVHKEMENHGVTEIANGSMEIACPKVFCPSSIYSITLRISDQKIVSGSLFLTQKNFSPIFFQFFSKKTKLFSADAIK
jgi:hypothetical protein